MPETPGPHFGKTLDVIMLAVTGGRERTEAQHAALLAAAGFRLDASAADGLAILDRRGHRRVTAALQLVENVFSRIVMNSSSTGVPSCVLRMPRTSACRI